MFILNIELRTMDVLHFTPFVPKYLVFLEVSNGLAHMDVYRHILESRFTHFAPYVVTC